VLPHAVLVVVGLWTAWRPCETFAATPLVLAVAVLALVPWAVRHTRSSTLRSGPVVAAAALLYGGASSLSGWDPASAVTQLALALAVLTLIWLASRTAVSIDTVRVFALGVALLALWALWQAVVGFEQVRSAVPELPQYMQENAAERLASGRAFASLVLPGHLAAILAMVLPLLLAGVRRSWATAVWVVGCVLCVIGLILTYSPAGIGLALAAGVTVVVRRRHALVLAVVAVLVIGAATTFFVRPDLARLEPLQLRLDNWRTALWVWSTSPVAGVGLGGYGQASRAVPFEVGNRPAHAHSLPLEWAAELGLAGVAAVAAAVLGLVVLVRRLWPVRPELAAAVAVVPLHNLVDFSLYTSGVALPWAVLVGWGLAAVRRTPETAGEDRLRPVAAAAAAVGVALALLHTTSVTVAGVAAAEQDPAESYARAVTAHRLAPWPCVVAALESADPSLIAEANGRLAASRWLRPQSAMLAGLASRLDLAQGRISGAVVEAWTAAHVQPSVTRNEVHLRNLIDRLAAAEHASKR
jgi:O-antigen ligase